MCALTPQAKVVIPEKEKETMEYITWQLDKQENDTLPQVTLNQLDVREREMEEGGGVYAMFFSFSMVRSSSWCPRLSS